MENKRFNKPTKSEMKKAIKASGLKNACVSGYATYEVLDFGFQNVDIEVTNDAETVHVNLIACLWDRRRSRVDTPIISENVTETVETTTETNEEKENNDMTLYDFIKTQDYEKEIAVFDTTHDMEVYFYNDYDCDQWQLLMFEFSKKFKIVEKKWNGVIVNFSEVIRNNMENIEKANIFSICTVRNVMNTLPSILSGNVTAEWFEKFVNAIQ